MHRLNFRNITTALVIAIMLLGVGSPMAAVARAARVTPPAATRPAQRPAERPAPVKPDRNTNINDSNVNIGNETNVNVDRGYGVPARVPAPGYYPTPAYPGGYYDDHYSGEQVAGAFIAGIVIGAILADEPDNSNTVVVHDTEYLYDGTNYYVAVYEGSDVVYKVVEDPH